MKQRVRPSTAAEVAHQPYAPGRRSFAIGWLSITLATALVFVAFAGPLLQNGQAAALSERLTDRPVLHLAR